MIDSLSPTWKTVLSIVFFPLLFEAELLAFAWGAGDPLPLMIAKRAFLLLPVGAVLLALWASIFCLLTVPFRYRRVDFLVALVMTWWSMGRAIFSFWAGALRFVWTLVGAIFSWVRLLLTGAWLLIQDVVLAPVRLVRGVAGNLATPGVPWLAVLLTCAWCLLEAVIFTHVMTPLVTDTLANMTGRHLPLLAIQIPLFLFLLILVLGSYAVLASLADAVRERNWGAIARVAAVEVVAAGVEVIFLYREFVDALVPWFAQHTATNFDLGITGTLAAAGLTWLGIRGMTWFLFASHGTPVLLAVIRGAGWKKETPTTAPVRGEKALAYSHGFYRQVRNDLDWVSAKGEELLASLVLPPLQVVAASLNFVALFLTAHTLFELPFKSLEDLAHLGGGAKHVRSPRPLRPGHLSATPAGSPGVLRRRGSESIPPQQEAHA